jgi:glycosyltransferase involved in cell wall biosynthesis
LRAYESIKKQILKDWEWVILDDSPEDEHFVFLKKTFTNDKRVRLYKRSENSGSIGNVKNEAVSLCRGKYVLEMDHDDEILPEVLFDATKAFESNDEIGFVYMDYANVYEDWRNFNYGNHFSLGYAGYYRQKYNDKWLYVAVTPNINNVTLSHIVSIPNHPRIWKKETLLQMGNYSEFLPVCDDYELLLRTASKTKIAKIQKLGYIQYMNNDNNNFSLIRNAEINRLVYPIKNICYESYNIDEFMKSKNAYEVNNDNSKPIWKRANFQYKYCNEIINLNYKKQYCIIGLETINKLYADIKKLYSDETNDFIVLDNKYASNDDKLCNLLDFLKINRMKCYSMEDTTDEELVAYFHLVYRNCNNYHIIKRNDTKIEEKIIEK